ncbi:outer membrane beta-barrel family protein [Spirosoma foliorum]|uniref:Outer membrane beta-barrel protein n=1 Tax=Spirosoma foliorum TaxID=2710596 RepID=A0A7G5GSC4_9BACT|nr:outer membrane beta-barrel family protein [Spirosoma foliorum]QMW01766.1 outer membrane beta-barrel protein [Spirosoma foliorum]
MKFFSLFVLLLLAGSGLTFAQKVSGKAEVIGVAVDSVSGKPLRMATVSLMTDRDSSYIDATITNGDGQFRLRNVGPGRYRILVTFLGYRNASSYITVGRETPINAGTIRMIEQASTLNEVTVRQERSPVAVKGDTVEFNAGSFKTQPNAQVEELLRKLPGVEVARDGSIKAQGQTVNRVLVDGKPFFGNDPKMATRNLPADIVDKVQLYDQSSDQSQFSGIDDGNRERTINLTIKRNKQKGYFGQNSIGAGTDERYQGRLNLNRFNNRGDGPGRQLSLIGQANNLNQQNFTLGGGTGGPITVGGPGSIDPSANQSPTNIIEIKAGGLNFRDKLGKRAELSSSYFLNQATTTTDQRSRRENVLPDRSFLTDQHTYSQNRQTTHRFNGRLDWQLDSLTSLRISPNVSCQATGYDSRITARSYLPTGQALNDGDTHYGSTGDGLNGYNNLLVMRKFRKEGRTLSVNLNTVLTNGLTNALNQSINQFYDSTGTTPLTTIRLNQRNRQNSYSLQNTLTLSLTEPLSLTQKLELRYAYAANRNRAERDVIDASEATGQYDQPNAALSNHFSSLFATHRIGTTLQTRRLRYTYALGFDLQQANLEVDNRSVDTSRSRQYLNLLPSALLSYTFSRNRSLRLQYRTRITPPSVTQLQPIVDNTNPLTIRLGNPGLRPEYYNNITLTYNGSSGAGGKSLFIFASLNQSTNRISTTTTINSAGAQTTQPINAGGYLAANGSLSIGRTLQPTKLGLTLTTNASFSRAISLINDQTNEAKNVFLGQGVRLQSAYNGKLDYGLSGTISYQTATYSLLSKQNSAFWSQYATVDVHWQLPFNFVLTSDLTYTATTGRAAGYNQQFTLWNAALAWQFLKAKQGEFRVQAFDLLNQNRSVIRNTGDSYVEDVQSRVLTRYFMVSFVYNLRKFGV